MCGWVCVGMGGYSSSANLKACRKSPASELCNSKRNPADTLRPHTHTCTRAHIHARTHARTHAHTHTHTHTHAHVRYAWYDAESAGAFLLNIPTRFDFECKLHEMRDQGQSLTPALLKETMAAAWEERYGDTLEVIDEIFLVVDEIEGF